jgi:hypothetical protein
MAVVLGQARVLGYLEKSQTTKLRLCERYIPGGVVGDAVDASTGSCFGIPGDELDDEAETMRVVQSSVPGGCWTKKCNENHSALNEAPSRKRTSCALMVVVPGQARVLGYLETSQTTQMRVV